MKKNLRGAYMNFAHDRAGDWAWLRDWQPSVVRLMLHGSHTDPNSVDVNRIHRVHETVPGALLLLRVWDVDDRNGEAHRAMAANPIAEAGKQLDWWARVFDRISVPRGHLIAGLNNEVNPATMGAALYAYTERACRLGTQREIRLGAGVFSVGNPGKPGEGPFDMTYFARLEDVMLLGDHVWLFHEYMQPEGMYAVWTDDEGHERHDFGNLINRHTHWPSKRVKKIIAEWGIDGLLFGRHPHPQYGNSGWKHFPELWTPERYADEYVACCQVADESVIAICPFMSDNPDQTGKWWSFDVLPAYGELLARKHLCEIDVQPSTPTTVYIPVASGPPQAQPPQPGGVPVLVHPVADARYRAVTQRWGENPDYYKQYSVDGVPLRGHNGQDFGAPIGTKIVAVDDGAIVETAFDPDGYGTYVKIRHAWGESLYAHLNNRAVDLRSVRRGELVGLSGDSGKVTGAHLHFGLRVAPFNRQDGWGGYTDPAPYLAGRDAPAHNPQEDIWAIVRAAAAEFDVDADLFTSLVMAESSGRADAVSPAGAKGLGQITDPTWAEWSARIGAGRDPYNPRQNARVGAAFLRWCLDQTGSNRIKALVAYNWGLGNLRSGAEIPLETRIYAYSVIHGADLLKALT